MSNKGVKQNFETFEDKSSSIILKCKGEGGRKGEVNNNGSDTY